MLKKKKDNKSTTTTTTKKLSVFSDLNRNMELFTFYQVIFGGRKMGILSV